MICILHPCWLLCLSVKSHLTSGASVRPENTVTYSAGNGVQIFVGKLLRCGDPLLPPLKAIRIFSHFPEESVHAHHSMTIASNIEDTTDQVMFDNNFVKSGGFRLCPEKCALVTLNKYLISCLMVDMKHLFLLNSW